MRARQQADIALRETVEKRQREGAVRTGSENG
jgi:hypothetical protein